MGFQGLVLFVRVTQRCEMSISPHSFSTKPVHPACISIWDVVTTLYSWHQLSDMSAAVLSLFKNTLALLPCCLLHIFTACSTHSLSPTDQHPVAASLPPPWTSSSSSLLPQLWSHNLLFLLPPSLSPFFPPPACTVYLKPSYSVTSTGIFPPAFSTRGRLGGKNSRRGRDRRKRGKKGELQKRVGRWATLDESRNEREESLHSANKILGRTRIQNNKLFESNDDGHLLIHVFI